MDFNILPMNIKPPKQIKCVNHMLNICTFLAKWNVICFCFLGEKQMIQAYYDHSGSLVMGPRTGTPMRLVSPAPVLVPPGAQARAPQSMYPPQPQTAQQNLYSQQNGSSVGGNI